MLCNITQNSMGQTPGGGTWSGPGGGVTLLGATLPGGTLPGGYPAGGYPGRVPPPARSGWGGYPAGGYPCICNIIFVLLLLKT